MLWASSYIIHSMVQFVNHVVACGHGRRHDWEVFLWETESLPRVMPQLECGSCCRGLAVAWGEEKEEECLQRAVAGAGSHTDVAEL